MAIIFVLLMHLDIFYIRRKTHSFNDWATLMEEARLIQKHYRESLENLSKKPDTIAIDLELPTKLLYSNEIAKEINNILCGQGVYLQRQFSSNNSDITSQLKDLLLINRLIPNPWFCGHATSRVLLAFLRNFPYQFLYANSRTLGALHAWNMADKLGLIEAGEHHGLIKRIVDHGFFGEFDDCHSDFSLHYTNEKFRWKNADYDPRYQRKPIECTWLWRINWQPEVKVVDVMQSWRPKLIIKEQHDAQHLFCVYLNDVRRLIEYELGSLFVNFHIIESICTEFQKRVFEEVMCDIEMWTPRSKVIFKWDWNAVFDATEFDVAMQKLKKRIEEDLYPLDLKDKSLMFINT